MRAFLLSLVGILIVALPAEVQAQAKVLRSITSSPENTTATDITVNLVPQAANITVVLKYGTDETHSLGTQSRTITSISPTYSPVFTLVGLVHGTKYFVQVDATAGAITETKELEFIQNANPLAKNDTVNLTSFTSTYISVLRNDRDPDNTQGEEPVDVLSIKRVTEPAFGRAEIVGKAVVYSPGPAFLGRDEFEYIVTDSLGGKSRATVTVTGLQFALFGSQGLLLQDLEGNTTGYLRIDVGRGGAFTGSLKLEDKSYALLGSFNAAGKFLGYARDGDDLMPVALDILQEDGVTRIRATLANGTIVATEETSQQTITSMEEIAGRYTIELPASSGDTTDEDGDEDDDGLGIGWAIMEIDEWGEVQIEGETADRRSFSTSALLTGTPDGPKVGFFAQQRNGFLSGVFTLGETVSGDLIWARDDSDSGMVVTANGGRWEEPEDDHRALANDSSDAGRMTISISGGNVPDFERELRISEDDRVTVLNPQEDELNLEIDRDNGTFRGKFRQLDDLDERRTVRGVFLQKEGRGSGLFDGAGEAGLVEISLGSPDVPDPDPVVPQPDPDPVDPLNPLDPGFEDPGFDLDFNF